MFVAQTFDRQTGALSMALIVIGFCAVSYGAILLFVKKAAFAYNGKAMKLHKLMFNADRHADVLRLYEAGDFGGMVYISRNSVAKMMLKILVTNDYSVAYSQLYTFSSHSHNFEPSTEIREHDADECLNIYMFVEYY